MLTESVPSSVNVDSQVITAPKHDCALDNHQEPHFDTLEHLDTHFELDTTAAS